MHNIQRISTIFRWLFQMILIILPVLLILFWMGVTHPIPIDGIRHAISINYIPSGLKILHPLSIQTRLLGFTIGLIPLVVKLLILYFLIKLFRLYEQAEIFSIKNVTYIKRIGIAMLIGQILNPIYQALLSVALTWQNPPGHRMIQIGLSQTNIGIVITAFLIILISWIMAEASKLREEQKYTV